MMPPSDVASCGPPPLFGFGWMAGWGSTANVQRSLPVASAIALNFPSQEPTYTVPWATIGVAVTARFAGTNHRCMSVGAVDGVSVVWPWNVRPRVRPNIGQMRRDTGAFRERSRSAPITTAATRIQPPKFARGTPNHGFGVAYVNRWPRNHLEPRTLTGSTTISMTIVATAPITTSAPRFLVRNVPMDRPA